jgi:hypothetical protein
MEFPTVGLAGGAAACVDGAAPAAGASSATGAGSVTGTGAAVGAGAAGAVVGAGAAGGSAPDCDEVCAPPELEMVTPGATSTVLAVID